MKLTAVAIAGVAILLDATPAFAHHSFAMFDYAQQLTLEGTVREFQWTNPHAFLLMSVRNARGFEEQWAIEMGTPIGLARQGWSPRTLSPGLQIMATIHPLKNGTHGGRAVTVSLPDGSIKGHPYPLGARTS